MFPEGTTTDGRALRTFHGRLLSAAIDSEVALQPVAIRYVRDGEPCALAPFIGDDDLLSHLMRLFANDRGGVEIHLLKPIACEGRERAALAFEAQQAVQKACSVLSLNLSGRRCARLLWPDAILFTKYSVGASKLAPTGFYGVG
jgi:1-acyl-sn-glycerol-3-phosphate acyltransferase